MALSERGAAVWAAIKAKIMIGMGMKPKKTTRKKATKKRIFPSAKRGGALPFLPMLGALESLIGGAVSVTKVINDSKAAHQLEELQRHNRTMEQSRGLYLAPYKYGRGLYFGPYKCRQGVVAKKKETPKRRCRLAQLSMCN